VTVASKAPKRRHTGPRFIAWFTSNPSGIPRRHALGVALMGVALGGAGGLLASTLFAGGHTPSLWPLRPGLVLASVSGAVLAPLGVVLVAHVLDRTVPGDDSLVGYSGLTWMLLHAGELSFLGALGGGIGAGVGSTLAGLVCAVLVNGSIGALWYRVRGLGAGLGLTLGVLTGALSGAIGGMVGRWGG
jgi:hypothetical protein